MSVHYLHHEVDRKVHVAPIRMERHRPDECNDADCLSQVTSSVIRMDVPHICRKTQTCLAAHLQKCNKTVPGCTSAETETKCRNETKLFLGTLHVRRLLLSLFNTTCSPSLPCTFINELTTVMRLLSLWLYSTTDPEFWGYWHIRRHYYC